jgi:hypothetical protein
MPGDLEGAEWRHYREAVHVPIGHYRVLHLVVWSHDHCRGEHLCRPPLGWLLVWLSRRGPCRPEAQDEYDYKRSHEEAGARQCPFMPLPGCTGFWLLVSGLLYHVLLSLLSLRTETWGAYMAVAHLLLHHGSRLCALLSGAADALAVAGLGALAVCDLWVGACHGTVE